MPAPLPGATRRRTNLGGRRGGRVSTSGDAGYGVGPVLHATPFARSVASVIEEETTHVLVRDEGASLRVLVPRVCRLSRAGLEAATGLAIRFPGDLEVVMSSFTGVIQLTEDGAVWRLAREPAADTAAPLAGGPRPHRWDAPPAARRTHRSRPAGASPSRTSRPRPPRPTNPPCRSSRPPPTPWLPSTSP